MLYLQYLRGFSQERAFSIFHCHYLCELKRNGREEVVFKVKSDDGTALDSKKDVNYLNCGKLDPLDTLSANTLAI